MSENKVGTTTTFKEKPNELKIFKTRKEIKECKEEGRVSPTKKLMDSLWKKIPNFTSFKSCNISHQHVKSRSPQRHDEKTVSASKTNTGDKKPVVELANERKSSPVKTSKSCLIPTKIDESRLNGSDAVQNNDESNRAVIDQKDLPNQVPNKFSQNEILSDDPIESTVQSNGIESRISQTIIMKKKRADASADAIIFQRLNPSPTKFNEVSKDMFVFTAPHKAKVSATVTLDRPPKVASLAGKSSANLALDVLTLEARSSSSNTLVPHMATNSVKSGSSCTLISTVSSSSGPVVNASVGNTLTVTAAGTAAMSNNSLSTNTISTTYSVTSLPPAMPNASTNPKIPGATSFADKLSRSFFDLTQGSQDRLQKWKNKLQTGKRTQPHQKDSSEPPPNRKMNGNADGEVLVDWTTRDSPEKPRFLTSNSNNKSSIDLGPRPLHASKSASQAVTRDFEPFIPTVTSPSLIKHNSLHEPEMEHRTLKQREVHHSNSDKNLSFHYQNMKNLQQLVETIEGYSNEKNRSLDLDLPPPARIMPFSGMKPQDDGIIRPIAFRPNPLNKNAVERQSFNSDAVAFFNKSPNNNTSPLDSNIENKPLREQSRSIGNLATVTTTSNIMAPLRTRPIPQPSTSSNSSPGNMSKRNARPVEEENEYDTVPEYIEHKYYSENETHGNSSSENYSHIYPFQQLSNQSSLNRRSHYSNSTTDTGHSSKSDGNHQSMHVSNSANHTNSPQLASSGTRKLSGSQQNCTAHRHSIGLHITPSPSDSGIVDYESLIRDKENELSNVRQAMEHNEEALVRVYQEKEHHYKDQIAELKQRLQVSQQGEATLRQQLSIAEDQRKSLHNTIQTLNNDKRLLQQKSQQIERELHNIRKRFDDFVRETSLQQQRTAGLCENCLRQKSTKNVPNDSYYENGLASMDRRGGNPKAPLPAPRVSKESSLDRELRSEVEDLRSEISTLRDQLNNQIQFFAEERRRWENERANTTSRPTTQSSYDLRNNNNGEPNSSNLDSLFNFSNNNPYRPEKRAVLYGNDRLI